MLVPTYTVLSCNTIKKKSITPCIIIIQWMGMTGRDGVGRKNIALWYWNITVVTEWRARNVLGCRHNNFFPNVSLQCMRDVRMLLYPPLTTPTNYTVWYSPEPWPYWCRRGKSRRNGIGLVSSSGSANLLKKKNTHTQRLATNYIQGFDDGVGLRGLVINVGKMCHFHRWWKRRGQGKLDGTAILGVWNVYIQCKELGRCRLSPSIRNNGWV